MPLFCSGQQSASVRVTCVSFLLSEAKTDKQVAMLVRLLESRGAGGPSGNAPRRGLSSPWSSRGDGGSVDTLRLGLERSLAHGTDAGPNKTVDPRQLWLNLKTLLKWEMSEHPALRHRPILKRQPVRRAITALLPEASNVLVLAARDSALSHAVATVLEIALDADAARPVEVRAALRVAHAAVAFFLSSLEDPNEATCVSGCRLACSLLSRLCARSSAARQLALRSLLEHALFQGPASLLGGMPPQNTYSQPAEQTEFRLLQENLKQVSLFANTFLLYLKVASTIEPSKFRQAACPYSFLVYTRKILGPSSQKSNSTLFRVREGPISFRTFDSCCVFQ